ncbi:MAG: ABC transporter substrate-binding protein [Pseudomonadota bacterium]
MLKRLLLAAAAGVISAGTAFAQNIEVPFALDWKFEAPSGIFFSAIDNGHFAAEGLDVTIEAGTGSTSTIPKIATGAFPLGFGDINSVIRFLDQNPGAPITAVMMMYDKPPFAIVGRKSQGVMAPKDLEGRTLGAPPPDAAWAQFPVFAELTGIDPEQVTVEPVGFPTREPMLAEGEVDAVAGFSFSSKQNLMRLGVPEDDIEVILMADHGLQLYGNAVLVNTDWAAENGETVTAFLRAVAKGLQDTIADPAKAIDAVGERNVAIDKDLELNRMQMVLADNIMTEFAMENGVGGIDDARMAAAIEQLGQTYEFQNEPDASLYFTSEFLPAADMRMLK